MVTTRLKGNNMISDSYSNLMDEVRVINSYLGTVGIFDALVYIKTNESDYEGTKVYSELQQFMSEGQRLFATKEPA